MTEPFPGVRVDVAARTVEFDALWAAPTMPLEVLVCIPDTREHEALAVAKVRPADVHAALLIVGLVNGKPGEWVWEDKTLRPIPPTGDRVRVRFVAREGGVGVESDAAAWVRNARTGATLAESAAPGGDGFVFAGSVFTTRAGREVYEADGAGTLIGLATFGTETIAWSRMHSPEEAAGELVWVADTARLPAPGTPVIIRLSPALP